MGAEFIQSVSSRCLIPRLIPYYIPSVVAVYHSFSCHCSFALLAVLRLPIRSYPRVPIPYVISPFSCLKGGGWEAGKTSLDPRSSNIVNRKRMLENMKMT